MARVNLQLVLLVALTAMVFYAPGISARAVLPFEKYLDIDKYLDILPLLSHRKDESGVMFVGEVVELITYHDGRFRCGYDYQGGFWAVRAGYNLDDNVDERMQELRVAGADYDKMYNGEECLTNMQITDLLAVDAKRSLNKSAENVKGVNDFCCSLRVFFVDIQHTVGPSSNFPREMEKVIDGVTKEDFKKAVDELEKTKWCQQRRLVVVMQFITWKRI